MKKFQEVTRLLAAVFSLTIWFFSPATGWSASRPPNIVFILMDDLGWADTGCYGSKFYQTPNIDRLASQGMRFTDGYAACQVCSPTRASILTGKYPARLHLTDWLPGRPDRPDQKLLRPVIHQHLPLEETTIADALKKAGYTTAAIGKWHLGGKGFLPEDHGFDLNIGGYEAGSPPSYFYPYKGAKGGIPGLEQGEPGEYLTDRLTAEAEKFIEHNREKPFFLYLAHYAVHIPLMARKEVVAKYEAAPKSGLQTNAIYAAMVESMDDSVGRILKKLEELKLAENTVVFFTSDNGGLSVKEGPNTPATSNAPLREGKGYIYEGGIREPWIVRWPGVVKPGSVSKTPIASVDVYPTVLEMAGVKAEPKPVLDGVSILPLLKETGDFKRDALYWHYPHYANQGGKPAGAIRQGDFKLIEFYEDGRQELFNLKDDIHESKNLAEVMPDVAKKLEAKLDAWRRAVGAQMMLPNPDFHPNLQSKSGEIVLPAKTADIHGVMVRFEPAPHKNTVGYWVRAEDWVSWDFEVTQPGSFQVQILQGCGKGSGGSEVEFTVANQTLKTVVLETGGFQNFVPRDLGVVKLDHAGRYTLAVTPKTKPGPAVMDLREVLLKPVRD